MSFSDGFIPVSLYMIFITLDMMYRIYWNKIFLVLINLGVRAQGVQEEHDYSKICISSLCKKWELKNSQVR